VADVSIAELLEAGVHFGHQTRRWNPKMRRFIYGERGGIYIIDLLKTSALLAQAQEFASTLAHRGGTVLFVGTKKQARDTVRDVAEAAGMPYVNHRWLGGLLTNFETISQRIRRLHDLERFEADGQLELLPTRERMAAQADLVKLRANLGGVKDMQRVPDAMFVIDLKTEVIAVKEAQRLRIPIMGLVDTNCDPDGIDFVIPGNDDAIRSCALITQAIGQVVAEGHSVFRAEEERARQEAEERARIEAEARAKREAEEQAKREAQEQAKREAEEQAAKDAAARAAAASPPEQPATPEPTTPTTPEPAPAATETRAQPEAPVAPAAAAVAEAPPAEPVEAPPPADSQTMAEAEQAPPADQPAEQAEEQPAEDQPADQPAEQAEEPPAEQPAGEAPEPSSGDGDGKASESETAEQTTETGAK
jgi:small subunit ribosomal protein S2